MPPSLSDDDKRRYARQLVLPEIGAAGQQILQQSHAVLLGAGGLGNAAAGYLAAMGIGKLTLIDDDRVELSNLQRQLLFEHADIGQYKVTAAQQRLQEMNPDATVLTHTEKLTADNAAHLIAGADIVLDGSDNFTTRAALHHACTKLNTPLIYAAISGFDAMITTFTAYKGAPHPCLHCFMPDVPARELSCAQEGIIGALAGVIGSMQALEAAKELLSIGQTLSGRILRYDALTGQWHSSVLPKDPDCHYCHFCG